MIERANLKQSAKEKLKGNWGTGVLITLVYLLITGPFSGLGHLKDIGVIFYRGVAVHYGAVNAW
jgi:uncharacterized membrane protein